jgi:hypothetical protein
MTKEGVIIKKIGPITANQQRALIIFKLLDLLWRVGR